MIRLAIKLFPGFIALLILLSAKVQAADTILTSMQATYSLATALTRETPIEIINVPEDGRQMSILRDYIARRTDSLEGAFATATAVISLTNVLPGDP